MVINTPQLEEMGNPKLSLLPEVLLLLPLVLILTPWSLLAGKGHSYHRYVKEHQNWTFVPGRRGWVGWAPSHKPKVAGSVPVRAYAWVTGSISSWGTHGRQLLSDSVPPPPKHVLGWGFKKKKTPNICEIEEPTLLYVWKLEKVSYFISNPNIWNFFSPLSEEQEKS